MKDEQYRLIAKNMFDALCSYHNDSINTIPEYLILDMLRLDMLPKDLRNKLVYGK